MRQKNPLSPSVKGDFFDTGLAAASLALFG
jgi:hypothetical protein